MLLHAARLALKSAEPKQPGWFNQALAALTFSAFAIESMGNTFGERIIPGWEDFERLNPYAKLRLLAERLDVPYNKEKDPWVALRWLSKFRNAIAHPKPEPITEDKIIDETEYEKRLFEAPKSKLERYITIPNASRSVKALEQIKKMLCDKLEPEDFYALASDRWSGSAKLHNGT